MKSILVNYEWYERAGFFGKVHMRSYCIFKLTKEEGEKEEDINYYLLVEKAMEYIKEKHDQPVITNVIKLD